MAERLIVLFGAGSCGFARARALFAAQAQRVAVVETSANWTGSLATVVYECRQATREAGSEGVPVVMGSPLLQYVEPLARLNAAVDFVCLSRYPLADCAAAITEGFAGRPNPFVETVETFKGADAVAARYPKFARTRELELMVKDYVSGYHNAAMSLRDVMPSRVTMFQSLNLLTVGGVREFLKTCGLRVAADSVLSLKGDGGDHDNDSPKLDA